MSAADANDAVSATDANDAAVAAERTTAPPEAESIVPAGDALAALGIDGLAEVERLPWLLALAALGLLWAAMRRRPSLPWPGLVEARLAGGRAFEPVEWLALALRGAALAALALALADPVAVRRAPPEPGLGLDLVLVLDTSGSMRALDAVVEGRAQTRLELARQVVKRFASARVNEGDRVALVVFGSDAFTQCPLTSDGTLLSAALDRVEVGMAGDATALGDALALAVKRATGAGGGSSAGGGAATGRLVVLLTDGRSNAGSVPVDLASELAAGVGVRVHTVAIGTGGRDVAVRAGPGGQGIRLERHDPDPETLRAVADRSGGQFFEARHSGDLESVYAEIDALERAPRPLPPRVRRTGRAEPLLAAAGGLVLIEILVARVWRRRLP